jgi:hydroxyacylglutathione hydrolase
MIEVTAIPGFVDNYFWLASDGRHAAIVDPGDAEPVRAVLQQRGLQPSAILITHHHPDHIGGVVALLADCRVPVYGPRAELAQIPFIDHPLDDGMQIEVPGIGLHCEVLAVPGHTLGHIAYFAAASAGRNGNLLFCGDTLFVAGCGRLFEGTPEQMHASLGRLVALPDDTKVCCAHEYTLTNLAFARTLEPQSELLAAEFERVKALRAQSQPSVPSTIGQERRFNPFLRVQEPAIRAAAATQGDIAPTNDAAVFAALRRWKDGFSAPSP